MEKYNFLSEIMKELLELSKDNYNIEEIEAIAINTVQEIFGNEIDTSIIKSINQEYITLAKTFLGTNQENQDALQDTIDKYHFFKSNEYCILDSLQELIVYDKLFYEDGKNYFYLLNIMGSLIEDHKNAFLNLKNSKNKSTLERGVAGSESTTIEKILSPINSKLDGFMQTEDSKRILHNVRHSSIEDSYETNFALSTIQLLGKDLFRGFPRDQVDALFESMTFFNSNKPIAKNHIMKSLKLSILDLYLENSFYQQAFNLGHHISHEKLAKCIDVIMEYTMGLNSKTNPKNLNKTTQIRSWYKGCAIVEYVRKGHEKLHPILKSDENTLNFLEKFKGKLPQKMTVNQNP